MYRKNDVGFHNGATSDTLGVVVLLSANFVPTHDSDLNGLIETMIVLLMKEIVLGKEVEE